jgi:cytochrome c553
MKKIVCALAIASMLVGTSLFADVPLNKKHKDLTKDGEKVNCAYCHTKAGNPKAGKDYEKYKAGKFCKGSGCH